MLHVHGDIFIEDDVDVSHAGEAVEVEHLPDFGDDFFQREGRAQGFAVLALLGGQIGAGEDGVVEIGDVRAFAAEAAAL